MSEKIDVGGLAKAMHEKDLGVVRKKGPEKVLI